MTGIIDSHPLVNNSGTGAMSQAWGSFLCPMGCLLAVPAGDRDEAGQQGQEQRSRNQRSCCPSSVCAARPPSDRPRRTA